MMYIIILLLAIIAIGVLLISVPGQQFLKYIALTIGTLGAAGLFFLIIGLALCLLLGLIILGIVSIPYIFILLILLAIWVLIFIIVPKYINKTLKTPNKKRVFWTIFFICLILLFLYRFYMNYYYPLHTGF